MEKEMVYKKVINSVVNRQEQVMDEIYNKLNGMPVTKESLAAVLQSKFPEYSLEQLEEICDQLYQGVQEGITHYEVIENDIIDGEASPSDYLNHILKQLPEEKRRNYLCVLYKVMNELHHKSFDEDTESKLNELTYEQLLEKNQRLIERESQLQGEHIMSGLSDLIKDTDRESELSHKQYPYNEEESAWIAAASIYVVSERELNQGKEAVTIGNSEARFIGQQVGFFSRFKKPLHRALMGYIVPAVISVISVAACFALLFASGWLMNAALDVLLSAGGPLFVLGLIGSIATVVLFSVMTMLAVAVPLLGIAKATEMHYHAIHGEAEEEMETEFADLGRTVIDERKTTFIDANEPGTVLESGNSDGKEAFRSFDSFGIENGESPVYV